MRKGLGESTQSCVMFTNVVKCQMASRMRLQIRPRSRSTSSLNHAMKPSPVHWMSSPPMERMASSDTQCRRGRNSSMGPARSSLFM